MRWSTYVSPRDDSEHVALGEDGRLLGLEFANGLAGDDGEPMPGVEPMAAYVTFEAVAGRTRMTTVTHFVDVAQMEAMLGRGMQEGMTEAISQIDALLSPASV